ncbi:type II secretion system minor pseudopilin GspK [Thalassovita aquimarina]|uniref:type II secretion system minor pseudopilin GspK n=1 Tax=Thalassovita aquimarina TaxID=2785917 RepID=UPI003561B890
MKDRGFVLINALVIVAALAAVAVLLLTRAETGRARLQAGIEAEQLTLGLDAFEALAVTLLMQDTNPAVDHPGEDWASAGYDVPLARGAVAGQIRDLQGLFNVNWLADPENTLAAQAFDRLLTRLAVPSNAGAAIRDFVGPGGPDDSAAFLRLDPPLAPVGGSILMLDQLRSLPGLSPRAFERLRPYLTALPGDSRLNVNTAPHHILAAFLPDLPGAALNRVVSERDRDPFRSVEAFMTKVGLARPENDTEDADGNDEDPATLSADDIAVGSDWFQADITARLDDRMAERVTVIRRPAAPRRPEIAWRISRWP